MGNGGHWWDWPTKEWCQNLRNQILITEEKLMYVQRTVSEKFPKSSREGSYPPVHTKGFYHTIDFRINGGLSLKQGVVKNETTKPTNYQTVASNNVFRGQSLTIKNIWPSSLTFSRECSEIITFSLAKLTLQRQGGTPASLRISIPGSHHLKFKFEHKSRGKALFMQYQHSVPQPCTYTTLPAAGHD